MLLQARAVGKDAAFQEVACPARVPRRVADVFVIVASVA